MVDGTLHLRQEERLEIGLLLPKSRQSSDFLDTFGIRTHSFPLTPLWHQNCCGSSVNGSGEFCSGGENGMLSQCANEQCAKPFLKLREGKLFLVETDRVPKAGESISPPFVRARQKQRCRALLAVRRLRYSLDSDLRSRPRNRPCPAAASSRERGPRQGGSSGRGVEVLRLLHPLSCSASNGRDYL
jgi:hypothetical protein